MEQSCPHSGPHAVNITVDILGDGLGVAVMQSYSLLLGLPIELLCCLYLHRIGAPMVVDGAWFMYQLLNAAASSPNWLRLRLQL